MSPLTSLRLRQNRRRLAITPRRRVPQSGNAEGFRKGLSKLDRMAFRLAVYASQAGLPRHHARRASRCRLRSPGWTQSTGPQRKVSVIQLIHVLLSQVAWRNPLFSPWWALTPLLQSTDCRILDKCRKCCRRDHIRSSCSARAQCAVACNEGGLLVWQHRSATKAVC